MAEQSSVAKFFVYERDSGLTFKWGRGRRLVGIIFAPGEASISVFPPERLMIFRSATVFQNVQLVVAEAMESAKRGDHGLTWQTKQEGQVG